MRASSISPASKWRRMGPQIRTPAYSWPGDDPALTSLGSLLHQAGPERLSEGRRPSENPERPGRDLQRHDRRRPAGVGDSRGEERSQSLQGQGSRSSNTIFSVTSNYAYNAPLDATKVPYGDKGFVVIRKGGDAGVYRKNEATQSGWNNDLNKFAAAIGRLPGDCHGRCRHRSHESAIGRRGFSGHF